MSFVEVLWRFGRKKDERKMESLSKGSEEGELFSSAHHHSLRSSVPFAGRHHHYRRPSRQ